jgi:transporter family protein
MWILFTILAALVWSINNVFDKITVAKYIKKPIVPVIIGGFVSLLFCLIILANNFVFISTWQFFLSFLIGITCFTGTLFYFKAIKIEEASRVVPLFALTLVWIAILAGIFLGEVFDLYKYFGIFIIFLGAILISIGKKLKFSKKSFIYMVSSTLIFSVYNILVKYLMRDLDYWTVFAYSRLMIFMIVIPFFVYYFSDMKELIERYKIKAVGLISFSQALSLVGVILFCTALSSGFLTLVEGVVSLQYLFVFIIFFILSILFPKLIKEEISKSIVFLKLVAIVMIIGGVVLIA